MKRMRILGFLVLCSLSFAEDFPEPHQWGDWRSKYPDFRGTSCCNHQDCVEAAVTIEEQGEKKTKIFVSWVKDRQGRTLWKNVQFEMPTGSVHPSEDPTGWICQRGGYSRGYGGFMGHQKQLGSCRAPEWDPSVQCTRCVFFAVGG